MNKETKKQPNAPQARSESATGTYRYDEKTGRIVKVSDRVPKVASKAAGFPGPSAPCGKRECPPGGCGGMA